MSLVISMPAHSPCPVPCALRNKSGSGGPGEQLALWDRERQVRFEGDSSAETKGGEGRRYYPRSDPKTSDLPIRIGVKSPPHGNWPCFCRLLHIFTSN